MEWFTKKSRLLSDKITGKDLALAFLRMVFAVILTIFLAAVLPPMMSAPKVSEEYKATYSYANLKANGEKSDQRALFLPTSRASFFRRLTLVRNAERTIDYTMHNNGMDDGGDYFYGALLQAADRGVKIRMVTDGLMNNFFKTAGGKRVYRLLGDHENIELYLYSELNILLCQYGMVRMHDKILNADDKLLLLGGANLGYVAYTRNVDAEVLISGGETEKHSAISQVKPYFQSLIGCNLSERKHFKATAADLEYRQKLIEKFDNYYESGCVNDENYNEYDYDKTPDYSTLGVPVDKITLCTNPLEGTKRAGNVLYTLLDLAKHSRRAAFFTPYFAYSDKVAQRFIDASEGKDEFIIQTNSFANTANIAYAVYNRNRKRLCKSLNFWEYQGEFQVHAKVAAFDDDLSVIGSFNLDERSAFLDTEAVLVISGKEFNALIRKFLNDIKSASLFVNKDNKYDSGEVQPRPVPGDKRAIYVLYSILSIPFVTAL